MPIRPPLVACFALALAGGLPAPAADLDGAPLRPAGRPYPPPVRGCPPPGYVTRAPTNAPWDPSYVGSTFGLSRPSYYGNTPPPGVDDPYGRRPC